MIPMSEGEICFDFSVAASYRVSMDVIHLRQYRSRFETFAFPVCPRCDLTLDREYQAYCDRCGQCLSWKKFSEATVLD